MGLLQPQYPIISPIKADPEVDPQGFKKEINEKVDLLRQNDNQSYVDMGTPTGTIVLYGGATAPTGWVLCNGSAISRTTYSALFGAIGTTFGVGDGSTTFNVPDCRGIFIRGAGTSGKLSDANSNAFAGTLGTYQNDKMQGHYHAAVFDNGGGSTYSDQFAGSRNYQKNLTQPGAMDAIADGTNGTPRVGAETNPANLSLTYIIKA